jgi:hypothetical protein
MSESPISIKTKEGDDFEIPVGGSLGLLALGYKGLMLWREKREQDKLSKSESQKESIKTNEEK